MKQSAKAQSLVFLGLGLLSLALFVVLASVEVVQASDPPHWTGATTTLDCSTPCHTTHSAPGGQLTSDASNTNLCQSCHVSTGLPIDNADMAIPHFGGRSHAFEVPIVSATYGDLTPQGQDMLLRIMDGNVVCSTCHDQHKGDSIEGGTPRISEASQTTAIGGAGTVTSSGTFNGVSGLWYLLDIADTGSQSSARYRYSKDNGTTWFPSGCAPGNLGPCRTANTSATELDSGVFVAFSGADGADFQVGEQWELSAAWPFLRTTLDQGTINSVDKFCRDCHREWVMTHETDLVAGGGVRNWDGNMKSHPVGVGLNANSKGYDRLQPLDGNGQPQTGGASPDVDLNPTNDLAFDDAGNVQCLSCHGVHYADSNTLSVDSP